MGGALSVPKNSEAVVNDPEAAVNDPEAAVNNPERGKKSKDEVYDSEEDGSYTHPQIFFEEPITAADLAEEKIHEIEYVIKSRQREYARIEADRRICEEKVQRLLSQRKENEARALCIQLGSYEKLLHVTHTSLTIMTEAKNTLQASIIAHNAAKEYAQATAFLNCVNRGLSLQELRHYKQKYRVNAVNVDEKVQEMEKEDESAEAYTKKVYARQVKLAGIDILKEINTK